jgi:hypothetical protein
MMKHELTRKIIFDNTPDSTLYKWSLKEVDLESNKVGSDQIPWRFSSYFILNDLTILYSVSSDWQTKQESNNFEEIITIKAKLQSGFLDDFGVLKDSINFSMFGTDRAIKDISLRLKKLTDESQNEVCVSDGIVSYVSDVDFREEKVDDCLDFTITLRPSIFDSLVKRVEMKSVSSASLRIRGVDGFYDVWSPSIFTRSVKVLTSGDCHKPENDPSQLSSIPTLGKVEEFNLVFQSSHELYKEQKLNDNLFDQLEDKSRTLVQTTHSNIKLTDQDISSTIYDLRKKLNLIIVLLSLVTIILFLKS